MIREERSMKRLIATTLLGLAATSIPCVAQYTSGGNAPVAAPNTDSYYNFTVVDQNNPFSADGLINYWQVYASAPGDQIELLIVQPGTYDIVGTSSPETTTVAGLNTFTLSTPISVTAGDYIGFWEGTPQGGPSSVEFSYTGGTMDYTSDDSGPPTSPLSFEGSQDRTYSIYASTPEGGASWLYLLLAGAACLGAGVFTSRARLAARP
jgi:hypothetical protein